MLDVPPKYLTELQTRHASQLRVAVLPITDYITLNTDAPPFDDVRVRRALNYALDRQEIVRLYGGVELARLTCQVLPPNFPGFAPYCPYTRDPGDDGTWTAPNLSRARDLIAASDTTGMHVRIMELEGQRVPDDLGDYFVSLLESLGYETSLKSMTDVYAYYERIYSPGRPDTPSRAGSPIIRQPRRSSPLPLLRRRRQLFRLL
jgi:peptide/nickel transport system substrate-binding protein